MLATRACAEAVKTCWAEIQMKAHKYQLNSHFGNPANVTDGIVVIGTDGR